MAKKKKTKRHTITVNDETYRIFMTRKYPTDTWDDMFQREILPVMDGPEQDLALQEFFDKESKHGPYR